MKLQQNKQEQADAIAQHTSLSLDGALTVIDHLTNYENRYGTEVNTAWGVIENVFHQYDALSDMLLELYFDISRVMYELAPALEYWNAHDYEMTQTDLDELLKSEKVRRYAKEVVLYKYEFLIEDDGNKVVVVNTTSLDQLFR